MKNSPFFLGLLIMILFTVGLLQAKSQNSLTYFEKDLQNMVKKNMNFVPKTGSFIACLEVKRAQKEILEQELALLEKEVAILIKEIAYQEASFKNLNLILEEQKKCL